MEIKEEIIFWLIGLRNMEVCRCRCYFHLIFGFVLFGLEYWQKGGSKNFLEYALWSKPRTCSPRWASFRISRSISIERRKIGNNSLYLYFPCCLINFTVRHWHKSKISFRLIYYSTFYLISTSVHTIYDNTMDKMIDVSVTVAIRLLPLHSLSVPYGPIWAACAISTGMNDCS